MRANIAQPKPRTRFFSVLDTGANVLLYLCEPKSGPSGVLPTTAWSALDASRD